MSTEATPPKFPLESMDIAEEKRRQLKQLFPEAFTEAWDAETGVLRHAVDWEKLKASLGEVLEREGERFGLSWPGKSQLLKVIQQPSVGTLKPCRKESVKFDETENLFIEGDNLEVLKLLQKSYFGKVKMIYIDPPYNTGNEFVYPDNFTESLQTYLQYTGMVDAQGRKFSTNAATEGRFHSKWLNMMYPRLFLARNLLKENGVILVSISDHEVTGLRNLMNEIFGEDRFLAQFVWKSRKFPDSRAISGISTDHEYVVVYGVSESGVLRGKERDDTKFSNPDNDPRGEWMSRSILGLANKSQRPNLHFTIKDPNTGYTFDPPADTGWRYSVDRMEKMIREGCILFPKNLGGRPREKKFKNDLQKAFVAFPSIIDDIFTSDGTTETRAFFGGGIFDFAKPSGLVKRLIEQGASENDYILDFFSGSSTTAHSILDLNKEDGGNRKFIMVQLPEPCDEKSEAFKAGYKTIADIGKERIRRVIQKIEKEQDGQLDLDSRSKRQDLGFKVFKLTKSNFNLWEGDDADPEKIKEQLEMHINHLDPKASTEDILYELLLKAGFPLTTKVETISIADKSAYSIAEGALIICLDKDLTNPAIQAIATLKPVQCICLDVAFHGNDQLKTNAVQTMESAKVQFRTV